MLVIMALNIAYPYASQLNLNKFDNDGIVVMSLYGHLYHGLTGAGHCSFFDYVDRSGNGWAVSMI